MRIHRLILKNYRGISEADIDILGGSTVFYGINGSGKSSILNAVNVVYSRLINRIVQNRFKQQINIESTDVQIGTSQCEIVAELWLNRETFTFGRRFEKKLNKRSDIRARDLESFASEFIQTYESMYAETPVHIQSTPVNMPIFVNYGVNRLVADVPLRIRKTHVFDPVYAYENAIQSTVDFRTFFEWFRNREDYENEIRSNENQQYRDTQLQAVRDATLKMIPEFSEICVKRNPLSMKVCKNGVLFDVRQLSDGEKCLLALVGDLARRAAMANPAAEEPLSSAGVVLIDEIELHLHPTWQRRSIRSLRKVFPNIQFLITTHSPQVLGDIPDDMQIYELSNINSQLIMKKMQTLRGWDVNSILENNMHTSSINTETRGLIDKAYELIKDGEYTIAESLAADLEQMTSSRNGDVLKLRFLISRGLRQ